MIEPSVEMSASGSSNEFAPATQAELSRYLSENAIGPKRTICPVGGRTALPSGTAAAADIIVSTSELNRVVDYPARDMTITVEAGIRIDALQALLLTERQRLPIDVAQPGRATLGGAVATNTSGPHRFGHGTFRDFVIGMSAVDAQGQLFKAGGRVVKNVAGYDICKLMVGSRGTLAILTQVTLKLRPVAETSALLWMSIPALDSLEPVLQRLLLSSTRPVAIEVLNPAAASSISTAARCPFPSNASVLCIGVEGSQHEVDWQLETLKSELKSAGVNSFEQIREPEAARLWEALTEFPTCADDPLTFQANLLPSRGIEFSKRATQLGVAIQLHAGNGIVIGQLPAEVATVERATAILNELGLLAKSAQGNLVVMHCDPEWRSRIPMFAHPEPSWGLMQRLKRQLDPNSLLNPGELLGEQIRS